MRTRSICAVIASALCASSAVMAPSAIASPSAAEDLGSTVLRVDGSEPTGQVGQCPDVALVVARGSEQNDHIEPQRYSDDSKHMSNGYEGVNFRNFLHQAEDRFEERTGQSLLANVDVVALNGQVYPASMDIPAIAAPGEELTIVQTLQRVGALLAATPLHVLATNAVKGFLGGLDKGRNLGPAFLKRYEKQTGCTPQYFLMGYSQGALVLSHMESALAKTGRLKGVLYMGNPLMGTASVHGFTTKKIGYSGFPAGLLGWLPAHKQPQSARVDHVELCSAGDFACDSTFSSLTTSLASRAGQHAEYFLDVEAYERVLAEDPKAAPPTTLTHRPHTKDEITAMDELARMITK